MGYRKAAGPALTRRSLAIQRRVYEEQQRKRNDTKGSAKVRMEFIQNRIDMLLKVLETGETARVIELPMEEPHGGSAIHE